MFLKVHGVSPTRPPYEVKKNSFNIHFSTLQAQLQSFLFSQLRMTADYISFSGNLPVFQSSQAIAIIFAIDTAELLGNIVLTFQQSMLKGLGAVLQNAS